MTSKAKESKGDMRTLGVLVGLLLLVVVPLGCFPEPTGTPYERCVNSTTYGVKRMCVRLQTATCVEETGFDEWACRGAITTDNNWRTEACAEQIAREIVRKCDGL